MAEVNAALGDSPEPVNTDPYGKGWMIEVKLADPKRWTASWTPTRTPNT